MVLVAFAPGGIAQMSTDVRLNSSPAGSSASEVPKIAAVGPTVYVAWADRRHGPLSDIYCNVSHDSGTTWRATDIRLDTDGPGAGASERVQLAATGDSVFAAWDDARDGAPDIYLNYSLDAGVTWQPSDIRLDTDCAGAAISAVPQIAISGDSIVVVWEDYRDGQADIRANVSSDGGLTWLDADSVSTATTRASPCRARRC